MTTTRRATTTPPASTASTVAAATGRPIKVGFSWAESGSAALPDMKKAADAAVKYVNEQLGGVKGRPLELVSCGTTGTPESSTVCANNFKDAGVSLVAVSSDPNEAVYPAIVQAAGIPLVDNAATGALLASPRTYVMSSGALGSLANYAKYGQLKGYKKMLLVHVDNAGAAGVINLVKPAFDTAGVKLDLLPIGADTADVTPAMQTAIISPPDYIGIFGTATTCIAALKAKRILSIKSDTIVTTTCLTPDVIKATGADAVESAITFSSRGADPADPDFKSFVAALAKYSPGTSPDGVANIAFPLILDVHDVLETMPATSQYAPAEVNAAFAAVKDMNLFMSGGATATCDGKQLPAPFIAVCATAGSVVQLKSGKLTKLSSIDPKDLFKR